MVCKAKGDLARFGSFKSFSSTSASFCDASRDSERRKKVCSFREVGNCAKKQTKLTHTKQAETNFFSFLQEWQ